MKNLSIITRSTSALMLVLLVALGGCTNTAPASNAKLAVAEAAVERVNTPAISERAPGELQIAIAKLASAKQASASKNYELADRLAVETTLDAQVAERRAQSVSSQIAAQESQDAARVLREEINRNSVR